MAISVTETYCRVFSDYDYITYMFLSEKCLVVDGHIENISDSGNLGSYVKNQDGIT